MRLNSFSRASVWQPGSADFGKHRKSRACRITGGLLMFSSSIHGIIQARVLEWVAISFCRGSFQPRDQTSVSRTGWRFRQELIAQTWQDTGLGQGAGPGVAIPPPIQELPLVLPAQRLHSVYCAPGKGRAGKWDWMGT